MYFALVNGDKKPPTPRLEGICPSCHTPVIPKCGKVKTWHWAHKDTSDCDAWSEPLTDWHLAWQSAVLDTAVEVVRGSHRADIIGNDSTVIELQHSPIKPEEIKEREDFYGNIVWLFDATDRFLFQVSGDRVFFSFGPQEAEYHIKACKKPVFLDFGDLLVEVETFTDKLLRLAGFGLIRSREWFRSCFLSSVLALAGARPPQRRSHVSFHHWKGKKCPFDKMPYPTKWRTAANDTEVVYPAGEKYFPLTYNWVNKQTKSKTHVQQYVIETMSALANGWTLDEIESVTKCLSARVVVIGGLLRLIPANVDALSPFPTTKSPSEVVKQIEGHIRAGRLPLLKPSTVEKVHDLVRPEGSRATARAVGPSRRTPTGDEWWFK
jgi:competence protein CoiA